MPHPSATFRRKMLEIFLISITMMILHKVKKRCDISTMMMIKKALITLYRYRRRRLESVSRMRGDRNKLYGPRRSKILTIKMFFTEIVMKVNKKFTLPFSGCLHTSVNASVRETAINFFVPKHFATMH